MKYIYVVCRARSPRVLGVFTELGRVQMWIVNSIHSAIDLEVWRFVDGDPGAKVDKIQWNSGKVIE